MNRRSLLSGAAAWTASSYGRVMGANARIGVALIGCGNEGGGIMASAVRPQNNADAVALCDVYQPNLERMAARIKPRRTYGDFRKLLEDREVDAVMIATPDHWHSIPAILACQAGKDVYVEKPIAHNIREGRKIVDAARRYKRIVQVGTQGRTALHTAEAVETVRSGQLGEVRLVRVWGYHNDYPDRGPIPPSEPPPGLDWDFFVGPAPAARYTQPRHRNWRAYYDYGGGTLTDMGVHLMDIVQRAMGEDAPAAVSAVGKRYVIRNHGDAPDVLEVTYEYKNFIMQYESCRLSWFGMGNRTAGVRSFYPRGDYDRHSGIAFFGSNGTMLADPDGYEIFPEPKGPGEYRMERKPRQDRPEGNDGKPRHVYNWIDCIRSRSTPNAEAEVGHRATITPHLGNIAWQVNRKLLWDRGKEVFTDGPREAVALLSRTPRAKYAWA